MYEKILETIPEEFEVLRVGSNHDVDIASIEGGDIDMIVIGMPFSTLLELFSKSEYTFNKYGGLRLESGRENVSHIDLWCVNSLEDYIQRAKNDNYSIEVSNAR